jgi:site-specific DNA-methyltransferase (adenine-specific)
MLYTKDNLQLMQELQSESIDLIYCDILYGTGKKFSDYQDLKADKQVINNFYIPRIKEMHRVLKSTGTIYLQMDTRINHWVRNIMDDLFIFRNEIVWDCEYRLKQAKKQFTKNGERILFYTKSNDYTFNLKDILVPHKTTKEHQERCKNTPSVKSGKFKTPFNADGKNCGDVWRIKSLTYKSKENTGYFSQKPKELIGRIVKASSNVDDVVADFFLGSGTTAIVCKELNRKFIGCDINPKSIQITNERLSETSLF